MKTEFVKNPFSSLIISLSGPLGSFLIYMFAKNDFKTFSDANFIIFLLNIFPSLPLDGGVFLKSLLTFVYGYIKPYKFIIKVTQIFSVFLIFLGFILIIITKYNISLLIIGVFLLYNIRCEKMNIISLKKKLMCNEFCDKSILKVKQIAVNENVCITEIIDYISYNCVLLVIVYNDAKERIGEIMQNDIADAFVDYGIFISFGDFIRLKGTKNEFIQ